MDSELTVNGMQRLGVAGMPSPGPRAGAGRRVMGGVSVVSRRWSTMRSSTREASRIRTLQSLHEVLALRGAIAEVKGIDCDPEVVAVGTILHDIGLTASVAGPNRFEVNGAEAALSFITSRGVAGRRAQLIWDLVAPQLASSIALHKEPEVAVGTMGIALDYGGLFMAALPPNALTDILAAYPRLRMKDEFSRACCQLVTARPETSYDNFLRDFGERFVPGYQPMSSVDFLMNAPFEEWRAPRPDARSALVPALRVCAEPTVRPAPPIALAAVTGTFVGDIADIVEVEALRSTELIVTGSGPRKPRSIAFSVFGFLARRDLPSRTRSLKLACQARLPARS